ncbi:hypothetical protein [Thioclava sp.]|uniref:hypothetical protein n=1 Tax=Thioclava sp. TaxID=1933450 RepID=UPI003AA8D1B6
MKYPTRQSLRAAFFLVFTMVFLMSIVQGLTASSCRKEYLEPDKRIRYCSISTSISRWSILSEPYKRSILYAQRAVAYSQTNSHDKAIDDFKRAWSDAYKAMQRSEGDGSAPLSLRQKSIVDLVVRQGKDSLAEKNFKSALVDLGIDPAFIARLLTHG